MNERKQDLVLSNLSWPEVAAIKDQVELVLQPIGSHEQHGPNLAVCMDIAASFEFCRRVSERMYPRVLVAPAMPWGVSLHHMNFPGTLTLSPDTFIRVLVDIIGSLQAHGFDRVMIVNGHGGNTAPMGTAVVEIKDKFNPTFIGASSYFRFFDSDISDRFGMTDIMGHACQRETAQSMELIPQHVKMDALAPGELTDLTYNLRPKLREFGVTVPYSFDEFTSNGALGDATKATPEYGRALIESGLNNFVGLVEDILATLKARDSVTSPIS